MKNLFWIIFDIAMVIGGLWLIPIGFFKWKEVGFVIETLSSNSLFEGTSYLMMILMGIGLTCYGIFDFLIFRRKQKIKSGRIETP